MTLARMLTAFLIGFLSVHVLGQNLDNSGLLSILKNHTDSLQGEPGNWQFVFEKLPMLCITDEVNNRMRILTPVADTDDLTSDDLKKCLEANFHTALDVKYSISDNVLWVVFLHPLKELSEDQVVDAVYQVYNATATFGTTYSSTYLAFPSHRKKVNKKPEKAIDKS